MSRARTTSDRLSRRTVLRGAALAAGTIGACVVAQGRASAESPGTALAEPQPAASPTAAAEQPAAGVGQYSITSNPNLAAAARMGLIILLPHEWAKIPGIRAVNPKAKILAYKNLGAVSIFGTGDYQPSVVTYQQALAHPDWFLHDNGGREIMWKDFGGYLKPIDAGQPELIRTSVQQLITEMRTHGFDGIYLDDVNSEWWHSSTGSSNPVDFTGGSPYASATAWISIVVPQLRRAGLEVVANTQVGWQNYTTQLARWSKYLDGVCLEHFSRWGDYSSPQWGNFQGAEFELRRQQAQVIQSEGAYLVGISYGDSWDTAGMRYHRAMFLLLSTRGGYSMWCPSHFVGSHDAPAAMEDLGAPTSDAIRLSNGVWKRTFEKGFVVLNPTATNQSGTARSVGFGLSNELVSLRSGDALIQRW